ncbi:hypothetical protein GE061_002536 [Apolygus lucorum]|uniref:Uncharacterized protein n=1 Tax=Apolygus lucorum TaxID=248454 RepID=A0A8S9X7Z8_APOLU|nr:hypothetical protein GE061_002536 [Apolygus lucorum]
MFRLMRIILRDIQSLTYLVHMLWRKIKNSNRAICFGEAQPEITGHQEDTEASLPDVTHDENKPEQPTAEEHLELHPEHADDDNVEASHSGVTDQEQQQTTTSPDQQGVSHASDLTSGQQVEEETKPTAPEHMNQLKPNQNNQM